MARPRRDGVAGRPGPGARHARLLLLAGAALLYGAKSAPAPETLGWPEAVVGLVLCVCIAGVHPILLLAGRCRPAGAVPELAVAAAVAVPVLV